MRLEKSKELNLLKKRLKKEQNRLKKRFAQSFPHVQRFLEEKGIELAKIRTKSIQLVGFGALATAVLFSHPSDQQSFPIPEEIREKLKSQKNYANSVSPQDFIVDVLSRLLPPRVRSLTQNEENYIENLLSNFTGIPLKASLEGQHLNNTYGIIGIEQHLSRYPGDILANHGSLSIQRSGMAPGRGAWGYFAKSGVSMNSQLEEIERWYAVVQTMYLPQWNVNTVFLRDWYKYRKLVIVNTQNGNAVVTAIADAGPAAWTGKTFGASPEVMQALGGEKYKKGPVLVFFVDDPNNQIPLGPLEYNVGAVSLLAQKIK